jgi:hypothetical protein
MILQLLVDVLANYLVSILKMLYKHLDGDYFLFLASCLQVLFFIVQGRSRVDLALLTLYFMPFLFVRDLFSMRRLSLVWD